jgi:catechol 2,3-dioxygenase-like lactoylglutathione lyase family enzyme
VNEDAQRIVVTGWCHVGVRVHDLDRTLPFYELLGFEKTMGPAGPEPVAILKNAAGVEINLVLNAAPQAETNVLMDVDVKHPGHTHIALFVDSLDRAMELLEANGYPITEGPINFPGGVRGAFVRDPDGNVIELDERV